MIVLQQDHQPLLMMVELVHLHLLLIMVSIPITLLKILLMTMETMEVPLKLKEDLLQAVHQQQSVVPLLNTLLVLNVLVVSSLLVVSVRTLLVVAFIE
jgi:hypothetical protein